MRRCISLTLFVVNLKVPMKIDSTIDPVFEIAVAERTLKNIVAEETRISAMVDRKIIDTSELRFLGYYLSSERMLAERKITDLTKQQE